MLVFNLAGAAILLAGMGVTFVLMVLRPQRVDPIYTTALTWIVLDLLYRWSFPSFHLFDPHYGGHLFYLPVWTFGAGSVAFNAVVVDQWSWASRRRNAATKAQRSEERPQGEAAELPPRPELPRPALNDKQLPRAAAQWWVALTESQERFTGEARLYVIEDYPPEYSRRQELFELKVSAIDLQCGERQGLPPLSATGSFTTGQGIEINGSIFVNAGRRLMCLDPGGTEWRVIVDRPDASIQGAADSTGVAQIWNAASGEPVGGSMRHSATVNSAVLSPEGRQVVTASNGNTAQVWDSKTGSPIGRAMRHGDSVRSAVFSPDGELVLTASDDKTARLWEARTGEAAAPPMRHGAIVYSAAFSPDGSRVLTASADKTARLWRTRTAQQLAVMRHDGAVTSAAFSPNGDLLVTVSQKTAQMWNANGKKMGVAMQPDAAIGSAVFSPDNKWVLTGSYDKTAQLWEAPTGKPVGLPLLHDFFVLSAAFSPDGRWIVTMSDGARVWPSPAAIEGAAALADLAEVVGGYQINALGTSDWASDIPGRYRKLQEIASVAQFRDLSAPSLIKWYFASPAERTISPGLMLPVCSYIQQLIAAGTGREVATAFPAHALLCNGNLAAISKFKPRRSRGGNRGNSRSCAASNIGKLFMEAQQLARGLGWFSVGLGAAELFAPKSMSKLVGLSDHANLIRLMGVREIAAGIGLLAEEIPAKSMAARVGGDALDLALLGAGLISSKNQRGRVLAATAAVAGVTALDILCRRQLNGTSTEPVNTFQTVAVNRSPEECYQFWRNLENLPRFMQHMQSVRALDERRSHWSVEGPGGSTMEWDAEITEDHPNEAIAWRTLQGADVNHSGWVRFERGPAGHGTFVQANISYEAPGGAAGAMLAKLIGKEPGQLVKGDLRRFKNVIETGEISTIEGQPHGPRTTIGRALHAFDKT